MWGMDAWLRRGADLHRGITGKCHLEPIGGAPPIPTPHSKPSQILDTNPVLPFMPLCQFQLWNAHAGSGLGVMSMSPLRAHKVCWKAIARLLFRCQLIANVSLSLREGRGERGDVSRLTAGWSYANITTNLIKHHSTCIAGCGFKVILKHWVLAGS